MTRMQVLRIVFLFLLPVASGMAALIGRRRGVVVGTWRGNALAYGPVIGVSVSLAVFVTLIALSVAHGH